MPLAAAIALTVLLVCQLEATFEGTVPSIADAGAAVGNATSPNTGMAAATIAACSRLPRIDPP